MTPLPIDPHLPQIFAELKHHRRLVLVAEPGAGKTTRVAPYLFCQHLLDAPNDRIVMLQPRRVATRAAAARIASENSWTLGREVGYQVRGERRITADTSIAIVTEGILTRRLLEDPFLDGFGCVILDEFHERHVDTDLCIAMLKEVQASVREDIHLLVMSATIDAEAVAGFLGDCPVIRIPGRTFPVETSYAPPPTQSRTALPGHIALQIRRILEDDQNAGDVLVFLPGLEEIRRTGRALEEIAGTHDCALLPLHGSLAFDDQARVLDPLQQRKIILATNIAETSLTIDGVRTVVDSGLARVPMFDARRGMDRLELRRISRASATQRAGRAGRTAPGRCVRLWSIAEDKNLIDHEVGEIHRVDLAPAVLHVHAWGKADPRSFGWFQTPPERMIASAERLLTMLGALDASGHITALGRRMLDIPAHPRLARLMLAATERGLGVQAAAIASLLGEKDILLTRAESGQADGWLSRGRSDVLHRLELLRMSEQAGFSHSLRDQGIDPQAARQVARTRDDLMRALGPRSRRPLAAEAEDELLKLVLLAYPDRLCVRREKGSDSAAMVGGFGVRIAPESTVHAARLFVAVDAREDARSNARQALSHIISEVEESWLEELFPHLMTQRRDVTFEEASGRVIAKVQTCFADLPIREHVDHQVSQDDLAQALAAAARTAAPAIFRADENAAQLLQRIEFLRHHMPELTLPAFSDTDLGEILAASSPGKRSMGQLKQQDLSALLLSEIPWPARKQIDELAPTQLTVPSGSRLRVAYSGVQQPSISVRLQEIFGWTQTPRVAGGRVRLILELLGPNFRPVQVTSDLESFWRTAYFEVRKDLRVRYPKHSWPENPLTAKPEAKGRPRHR